MKRYIAVVALIVAVTYVGLRSSLGPASLPGGAQASSVGAASLPGGAQASSVGPASLPGGAQAEGPAGQDRTAGTSRKRVIQPPGYKPSPAPLSPAILVQDTLYLSGSTGGDPKTGELVKGGFEPELRQIMSNVQTVLATASLDLTDVVAVTAYLTDMADYARFNEIYKEYFTSQPLPTRSTVAVKELARGARLELTMTAVRSR